MSNPDISEKRLRAIEGAGYSIEHYVKAYKALMTVGLSRSAALDAALARCEIGGSDEDFERRLKKYCDNIDILSRPDRT